MYQARTHMRKCRPHRFRAGQTFIFSAAAVVAGVLAAYGCGLWPSGSAERPGPVQFAIRLTSLGDDRDWKGLRDLMVADFHSFDLEALMWAVRGQTISPVDISYFPNYDDPGMWSVQRFGEAYIVRLKDAPPLALTLRPSGSGGLEFDPGPSTLRMARWLDSQYARGLELRDLDYPSVDGAVTKRTSTERPMYVAMRLRHEVLTVHRVDSRVEVTLRVDILKGLSGRLRTGDVRWRSGTSSGQAQLLWTTAVLEDDPGGDSPVQFFSNPTGQGSVPYMFTVGLDNVPSETTVTLEVSDLAIGEFEVDLTLTIPLANVPPSVDLETR